MTPHFTLAELTRTDHRSLDNSPDPAALANLHRLAEFLEQVREVLGGRMVVINSAYRSAAVNAACGSRKNSQHTLGCAADVRVPGMTPDAVVKAVRAACDPAEDLRGDVEYKTAMAGEMTRRAILAAAARCH